MARTKMRKKTADSSAQVLLIIGLLALAIILVFIFTNRRSTTAELPAQLGSYQRPNIDPSKLQRGCLPGGPAWIQVTSPNGGETYNPGQQVTVTWSKCNTTEDVWIQFYPTSGSGTTVNYGRTANDGNQLTSLPFATGQYRVRIVSISNWNGTNKNAPVDDSDNSFSVVRDCSENGHIPQIDIVKLPDSPVGGIAENRVADLMKFRIYNRSTKCDAGVYKMSMIPVSTDGLDFVEKSDLRLKNLTSGNSVTPTNINYATSEAWFTIGATIPKGSYHDFLLSTDDVVHIDPYPQANINNGGVAYGVGQVDYEFLGSNTVVYPWIMPVWGNILTVLQ